MQALLPASPPPPSMPTSWKALTPSGRGAVARAAGGVAGPPAFVVAAAPALEADLLDGPRLLRERRRGAGGRRRRRPSCLRRGRRRPRGRPPRRPSPPAGEAPWRWRPGASQALLPSSPPPVPQLAPRYLPPSSCLPSSDEADPPNLGRVLSVSVALSMSLAVTGGVIVPNPRRPRATRWHCSRGCARCRWRMQMVSFSRARA